MHKYILSENLKALQSLEIDVDLVYIDPPYCTGRDFGDFSDQFDSMESYVEFIRKRVEAAKNLMKERSTFVAHVDPTASHYLKVMFDEVFGKSCFRNEIVWQTTGNQSCKNKFQRQHDTLLVYSKNSSQVKFKPLFKEYGEEYYENNNVKLCPYRGEYYVTTAAHNSQPEVNPRPNLRFEWNGHKKQWYSSKKRMERLDEENRLEYNSNGIPRIKRYISEMDGIPVTDVWNDISSVQSSEKLDYATQKPTSLTNRIIEAYTVEGDTVLDFFAGTGTIGRSCVMKNRDCVLIDKNEKGKQLFEQSIENIDADEEEGSKVNKFFEV